MAEDTFALARNVLVNAIRPALNILERGSLSAEQLILGTGIQESLPVYRQQLGDGPALGLFQMEPATHDDWLPGFSSPVDVGPIRDELARWAPRAAWVEMGYMAGYPLFDAL